MDHSLIDIYGCALKICKGRNIDENRLKFGQLALKLHDTLKHLKNEVFIYVKSSKKVPDWHETPSFNWIKETRFAIWEEYGLATKIKLFEETRDEDVNDFDDLTFRLLHRYRFRTSAIMAHVEKSGRIKLIAFIRLLEIIQNLPNASAYSTKEELRRFAKQVEKMQSAFHHMQKY